MNTMFCRQCEQTAKGTGCNYLGICGKTPDVACLQDLLIDILTAIGAYGKAARDLGVKDRETDRFVMEGLFSTVTNVDFDPERLREIIVKA